MKTQQPPINRVGYRSSTQPTNLPSKARLTVDRDLCAACGVRGGVNSMAWQLGIEKLEIVAPSDSKTIAVKPPKSRRK